MDRPLLTTCREAELLAASLRKLEATRAPVPRFLLLDVRLSRLDLTVAALDAVSGAQRRA